MTDKKKDSEALEIAESARTLWTFAQAGIIFLEEDPNRVRSFIRTMYKKPDPTKEIIKGTRQDLQRTIAWMSQSLIELEKRIKEIRGEDEKQEK